MSKTNIKNFKKNIKAIKADIEKIKPEGATFVFCYINGKSTAIINNMAINEIITELEKFKYWLLTEGGDE